MYVQSGIVSYEGDADADAARGMTANKVFGNAADDEHVWPASA